MSKIAVFGANSAIATAFARQCAARGDALFLVARDPARLEALQADLKVRAAGSPAALATAVADLNDFGRHGALLDEAEAALGGLDRVLVAHGSLPDQKECEASVEKTLAEINTNALSAISIATLAANRFEARKAGVIAVIGSVAGDRGRQSNYVYGAAKGMVDVFLEGLRNRLFKSGVSVVTIKPGFVDTPMTAHIEKKGPLWAKPDAVAAGIVRAMDGGANVAYLPGFCAPHHAGHPPRSRSRVQAPVAVTLSLALFDFDGTLTKGDSLAPFLKSVAGSGGLAGAMVASLPWLAGYALGLTPNDVAKQRLLAATLGGRGFAELEASGRAFARDQVPQMLRDDMMAAFRRRRDEGRACLLVSASLDLYLAPWAEAQGFAGVLCSKLAVDGAGRATGKLDGGNCHGREKVRRVRAWIEARGEVVGHCVAYGDTPGDAPMLDMADEAYWVRKSGIFRADENNEA